MNDPGIYFVPCLQYYNYQRRILLRSVLLIFYEFMSTWCPKTSKFGGVPNISYELCKPFPLRTMFKNGVECISCVLNFQDIVQDPKKQQHKN